MEYDKLEGRVVDFWAIYFNHFLFLKEEKL